MFFFFFNDTATTEIYTLSLHDALPIYPRLDRLFELVRPKTKVPAVVEFVGIAGLEGRLPGRSEEHTSELQSQSNIVCRLLLEKKKRDKTYSGGRSPDT